MLNPKHKLWRWGPIDGRPVYPDAWYQGQTANKRLFPPGWPPNLSLYKGERYSFVTDYGLVHRRAEKIFTRFILPAPSLHRAYRAWLNVVQRFLAINASVQHQKLKLLTDAELYQLVQNWFTLYSREFWGIGLLPELANLGGEALLRRHLEQKLPLAVSSSELMEKLAAPERLSFYQQEECDLLKLRLNSDQAALAKKLAEHQPRYYWILNSYHDTRVLPMLYFKKRLAGFSREEARRKLREISRQIRTTQRQKSKLVRKYRLGSEVLKIAHRLSYCIWWQDHRKSYIFQANQVIDVFLRELSRRFKVSFDDLHWYRFADVLRLVQGGESLMRAELVARKKYFVVIWRPNQRTRYLFGEEAKKIYDRFIVQPKVKQVRELRGQAVSSGTATGRVRVILSPKQAGKMKGGEVLVTTMTSPDFIVAMRKAVAVVTDVGGITSHAAIVSRELKIPCLVGTNIATKILKDGDRVEVDADKGIIRKL